MNKSRPPIYDKIMDFMYKNNIETIGELSTQSKISRVSLSGILNGRKVFLQKKTLFRIKRLTGLDIVSDDLIIKQ
jgi:hypothetical protein